MKNEIIIKKKVKNLTNHLHQTTMSDDEASIFLSVIFYMVEKIDKEIINVTDTIDAMNEAYIDDAVKKRILKKFKRACDVLNAGKKKNDADSQFSFYFSEMREISNLYKNPSLQVNIDIISLIFQNASNYAVTNGSAGGVVLTPPHIAKFMVDLLELPETATILDVCCGTGTLMAAAANTGKVDQIYGCDINQQATDLAMLSIFIKGVASEIKTADCFDFIKDKKMPLADAGLLNPPYAQGSYGELDYTMAALSKIKKGGRLAVICPNNNAYTLLPKDIEIKTKLMQNNTLKAVFSMPNDLFLGYGASVVSCVMLWEAGVPHDRSKPVFFGCYKDDGLEKRSHLGRIDINDTWDAIEKEWVRMFVEKQEIAGKSLLRCVGPEEQWIYEAYSGPDYTKLTTKDFEKTVRDYIAYCIR